jgi:hypothetical protein
VITVRDGVGNPISGALVEIKFSASVDAMVCWCPGQVHPIITGVTDVDGQATFYIFAGGCIDPDSVATPAIEIIADAVKLAEVGAVSVDAVDAVGLFPWQGWAPAGGSCSIGLADAVQHVPALSLRRYSFCSDFDADGRSTLVDAVLATVPIRASYVCP